MQRFKPLLLMLALSLIAANEPLKYDVEVQVVNLQVSVSDGNGNFLTDLRTDDFEVLEDKVPQEILDLNPEREPFSIGILLDTSGSMQRVWGVSKHCAEQFISAMKPEDEFFVMTFDDEVRLKHDYTSAGDTTFVFGDVHYGDQTRLYDAVLRALNKLNDAENEHRALFVISDGDNNLGKTDEATVEKVAQQTKTIVYSLIMGEGPEGHVNLLQALSVATGGTYFIMHDQYPFVQAAYDKIASDLAHRFTLYYRSHSDYSQDRKPEITVKMRNKHWHVQYQRTYYPES